ncbi:hypothetical protein BUALT_Bualt16G0125300 [Buddleja alternifolia]|uniref:C3H1-type domain-containing protein n=1 Tax=Buddleja alternifolia TaxID=168488 RepID=A0AAV6WD01_9LAMI|nr:hypothetical protein BUALT_Bualt16G0125300 [Buddleja alternifolia]
MHEVFQMAGCPFGENCHFLHFVPGGYNAVSQMMNLAPPPASRPLSGPTPAQNGSSAPAPAGVKTKVCNKYKTAEGCKFGDKCHFAHGEWELGKPIVPSQEDPRASIGAIAARYGASAPAPAPTLAPNYGAPPVPGHAASFGTSAAASFGASATAKISVDASLAGAIIGKGGVNSKQICRQTGAKLSIRDHETDPNLRNIELEGSFEQIKEASAMVREFIVSIGSVSGPGKAASGGPGAGGAAAGPGSNYKTKLCENFSKGSCTFGDRCHFAHGAGELRKTV